MLPESAAVIVVMEEKLPSQAEKLLQQVVNMELESVGAMKVVLTVL